MRRSISAALALSPLALAVGALAHAGDLPSGGQVTGGSGVIRADGTSRLVIDQSSARMAIDWSSFSIGAGKAVQFNQPDASSVALNRVTGVEPSSILGSLSANGKVFLVNPNGVLFGRDSQVSVGSLIATTQQITLENFMAGRYQFSAATPGLNTAVINQGRIQTTEGGTVGLIAARVSNEGSIHTPQGQTHLVAADEVLVDFGGPVKVQVQRGTLDAIVENGGAVTAPGGVVIFRADAANALSRSVINHTGIVEAQTLQAGPSGQILLLATGADSTLRVSGTLDASAPHGGNGGFIETSASKLHLDPALRVTTQAPTGITGEWLIDPTNIEIVSGTGGTFVSGSSSDTQIGATTIQTQLASSNVVIQTSSAGTDAGDITVSAPISWSANKLTLRAHNDIIVNGNLSATGTASLAFEYGAGRSFSFGNGVTAWIPSASSFTWKEGTNTAYPLFFNSGALRFGYSGGTNYAAINTSGNLLQPFYKSGSTWYKLTYSSYPLDLAIGVGGTETTDAWNINGTVRDSGTFALDSQRINIAGYRVGNAGGTDAGKAWGSLVSETLVRVGASGGVGGTSISISNTYSMDKDSSYMRAVTALTNPSTATSNLTNLRLWIGTRDDWVGNSDGPTKTKGNFVESATTSGSYSFSAITNATSQAKALQVSSGTETVFFYSTSPDANAAVNWCCSFSNAYNQDPKTSGITVSGDGSYALFSKFSNLTPGSSNSMSWFYAAGAVSDLSAVINQVAAAAQQAEVQQAAASNAATSLSLSRTSFSATYGQTLTAPTVTTNNTVGAFTYSSSNTGVAQVNATTGAVTLVGPGTATITISQAAGTGFDAGSTTYTVTVAAAQPALAGLPSANPRVNFNGSYTPPSITSASTGAISYSSSNPSIARVDAATGVVTPVGVGRVTITVTQAASGGYAATTSTYTLDVEAPALPAVLQTAQALSQSAATSAASTSQGATVSSSTVSTAANAIRSAARVTPITPPATLPAVAVQAPVEQVASQLPVSSGGLALMRVPSAEAVQLAAAPVVDTGGASSLTGAAEGASATTGAARSAGNVATASSAMAGGSDALGFMRVFVVGGGIQLPTSTASVIGTASAAPAVAVPSATSSAVPTLAPGATSNAVPVVAPSGSSNAVPSTAPAGSSNAVPTVAPSGASAGTSSGATSDGASGGTGTGTGTSATSSGTSSNSVASNAPNDASNASSNAVGAVQPPAEQPR